MGIPVSSPLENLKITRTADAAADEVVRGDDSRMTNARSASDVYSWAKAATKPSYSYSDVGAAAASHDHASISGSAGSVAWSGVTSKPTTLAGYGITDALASDYAWVHSGRDFADGTLIQTNINYAVTFGDPFVLEIRGNSYGSITPFDIQYQGYIYADTIINHGGYSNGAGIGGLCAINYNGNLCFWFPRQAYWHGYNVRVYVPYNTTSKTNRVTSITNSAKPTTAKQVDFSPVQSLHSGNFSSYAATASHNHDSAYAPIGKGVTNGDSHDHSGGDGAQIAYSSLSGLPTLGNAASKNVGTTAGTVCAGDDARLGAGNSFETSTSNMKMNGTASVGSLATVPRADHVHPTDTSRLPEVWPLDAQNNYATIQRKTGTRVGIAMHGGGQTNGLYIEDGLAGETGGVAIDNDGVTLFGAGDQGYIMRVVDEDRAAEGSTFEVRQDNRGTWVKNYVAPLGNIRTSDNGYGCVEFYNSGIGYQYAAKFCTFKAGTSEWYGITNDFDGGGSQLSLVAKAGGSGNIGFYIGSGTKAMTINSSGVATAIYGLYGAVGNDYADIYYCPIKRDQIQYRRVYVMSDGKPRLSMKYNEKGVIGIATNEQSFTAGKEELDGIPVSVGGFVSADMDRKYPAGTPLVCGHDGKLTRARWYTRIFSSHSILGFVLPDGRVRIV